MNAAPRDCRFTITSKTRYQVDLSKTQTVESKQRSLRSRCARLKDEIAVMEVKMHIERRWTASDQGYINTLQYAAERQYRRAPAQRFFELHQMHFIQLDTAVDY